MKQKYIIEINILNGDQVLTNEIKTKPMPPIEGIELVLGNLREAGFVEYRDLFETAKNIFDFNEPDYKNVFEFDKPKTVNLYCEAVRDKLFYVLRQEGNRIILKEEYLFV